MPTFRTSSGSTLGPAPTISAGLMGGAAPAPVRANASQFAGAVSEGGTRAAANDGQALQRLGAAVSGIGDMVHKKKLQRDREEVELFSTEARLQWIQRLEDMKQNAPEDGAGFTEGVSKAFGEYKEKSQEQFSHLSRPARALLAQRMASLESSSVGDAIHFESALHAKAMVRRSERAINTAAIAVQANPGEYDNIRGNVLGYLNSIDIDESTRADLVETVENDLAYAHLTGAVEAAATPQEVEQLVDEAAARFGGVLAADDFARVRRAGEVRVSQIEAARAAEARKAAGEVRRHMEVMLAGEQLPPEDRARTLGVVEGLGDPELAADWMAAEEVSRLGGELAHLPPSQQMEVLNAELEKLREGGVTPSELQLIEKVERVITAVEKSEAAGLRELNAEATSFVRESRALLASETRFTDWDAETQQAALLYARADNDAGAQLREVLARSDVVEAVERNVPLGQQIEVLRALTSRTTPAEPGEARTYAALQDMLAGLEKDFGVGGDALAAMFRRGWADYDPIDINEPASITARGQLVADLRAQYPGVDVPLYTADEKEQIKAAWGRMSAEEQAQFASATVAAGGSVASIPQMSIGASPPLVFNGQASAAERVAEGHSALAARPQTLPADVWKAAEESEEAAALVRHLGSMPGAAKGILNDVKGYMAGVSLYGDTPDFVEALKAVTAGKDGTGGWSSDFGGYILPAGVSEELVDDVLSSSLGAEGWQALSANGSPPEYSAFRPSATGQSARYSGADFRMPRNFSLRAAGGDEFFVLAEDGAIVNAADGSPYRLKLDPQTLRSLAGGL